jgi:hypothetical protein
MIDDHQVFLQSVSYKGSVETDRQSGERGVGVLFIVLISFFVVVFVLCA